MTKRKIGIFFIIAAAVFMVSRGSQVRHAQASAQTAPASLAQR